MKSMHRNSVHAQYRPIYGFPLSICSKCWKLIQEIKKIKKKNKKNSDSLISKYRPSTTGKRRSNKTQVIEHTSGLT